MDSQNGSPEARKPVTKIVFTLFLLRPTNRLAAHEPFVATNRQKRCIGAPGAARRGRGSHTNGGAALTLLCLLVLLPALAGGGAPTGPTVQIAHAQADTEAALQLLARGNLVGAAQKTRIGLQSAPGDVTLHLVAGAILLNAGDMADARIAFENARACDASDSLAFYGLALAYLGGGQRGLAGNALDHAAQLGGDRSYLVMARRYLQWLDGAQIAPGEGGVPEAMVPAQSALQGMAALRRGDVAQATTQLEAAGNELPGDGIVEPGGLLMTFDPERPLTAMGQLPAQNGLAAPLPGDRGLKGVVQLTPQNVNADVSYVSYELDGKSLTLVNVRPYDFAWNSTEAENGWHDLRIVLYDDRGLEISHVTQRIRVANPRPDRGNAARTETWERLHTALWQALTLQPARSACAQTLGQIYLQQGDARKARNWFARAAATRPDAASHRLLAASGGLDYGSEAMWGGLPDEKVVALTFDDGPAPGITEPLLDVLTQWRVPATFFVIGRHVMEYPDLTRKLDQAGMEIANHSYTHPNLTHLSDEAVARELMETQAAVETVVGKRPRFMRPPGGDWNSNVAAVVRAWGLTPCMWTVDVYGSEVIGAQQVADAVLREVRPGSIILMHNGKMNTLQALPTIIRELRKRGYTFATMDVLARRLDAAKAAARQANRMSESGLPRRTE
jgi:peptidoglycan-N-acetylglucosamine deacetylase